VGRHTLRAARRTGHAEERPRGPEQREIAERVEIRHRVGNNVPTAPAVRPCSTLVTQRRNRWSLALRLWASSLPGGWSGGSGELVQRPAASRPGPRSRERAVGYGDRLVRGAERYEQGAVSISAAVGPGSEPPAARLLPGWRRPRLVLRRRQMSSMSPGPCDRSTARAPHVTSTPCCRPGAAHPLAAPILEALAATADELREP
jgi:hypothetical protein